MKRIVIMVIKNLFILPWWLAWIWIYAREKDTHTAEEKHIFLNKLVRRVNRTGNVTIECHGKENIPEENGYILYPNHQGLFDVLALLECTDKPFSVVMKKEVESYPVIRSIIKVLDGLPMDRDDIKQSLGVIIEVTKRVKNGMNYVIFAEGTRSRNGNQLLDFKGGSFKAATKAKCPIVPVALINSFAPFDTGNIKPQTVQVRFLPPMYYEEYKDMKTTEIAEEVKNRIQTEINKNIKEI